MYQLILSDKEYEQFKKDAKVKMLQDGITYENLTEKTGYTLAALYAFFSKSKSRFIAYAIKDALKMEGEYGYVKED